MNMEHIRIWTARVLLGFVLITVGFSLGRHTAPKAGDSMPAPSRETVGGAGPVVVYAAHMTFRCPECTQIEWFARELVESEFADELAEGRLVFRTVDYMRDTAFARRYNIASSTVVVVREGDEDFERLDEVWTRIRNREEFFAYVGAAVRRALGGREES